VEVAHGGAVTGHSAGRVAGWEQKAVRMKAGSRYQWYGRRVHYMSDVKNGEIVEREVKGVVSAQSWWREKEVIQQAQDNSFAGARAIDWSGSD
jgi:hypothetical protein